MKLLQILVGMLLALFSTAFSEVTVKIISPEPGELIEPCQDVTFVADVQTTEGEQFDRVYFYNRLQKSTPFGYDNSAPWEKEMQQIKSGSYSITAAALLADKTLIESAPIEFTVGDSIAPEERLYNGGFYDCDSIMAPWGFHQWLTDEGSVSFDSIPELGNCIKINVGTILNTGILVSVYQGIKVEKDHSYELSFLAYVPTKRTLEAQILNMALWEDWLLDSSQEMEGLHLYSKQFTIEEIDPQKQYTLMIRARSTAVNDSTPFYIKWVSLKDITQSPSTEVTVKIASPENGDIFEPCQDITLVADIQTTEPDIVEKIRFYNNGKLIKFDTYFPWEFTIENIKSGVYNVTTQAYLKDGRKITSEVVKFFVVEDCIAAGECLYNQSFNCESIDPWYLDLQWFGGGEATVRFLSGDAHFDGGDYIMIDIEKVGHGVWSVQLWQKINYILGHTYKFSILLDADDQKQVQLEAGDGWSDGVQFTKAYNIEDVTLLTGEFTVNHVGQENFFSIGVGTNTRPLYIKQVSLIDTAAPDSMFYLIDPGTDIEYRAPNAVENYKLFQAYPNPFNPTTTIDYNLQRPGNVKLVVYNALGKKVAELVNKNQMEGSHSVPFDAQHLPTGIYLYQLQVDGEFSEMKKMLLLK